MKKLFLSILALALLCGCSSNPNNTSDTEPNTQTAASAPTTAEAKTETTPQPVVPVHTHSYPMHAQELKDNEPDAVKELFNTELYYEDVILEEIPELMEAGDDKATTEALWDAYRKFEAEEKLFEDYSCREDFTYTAKDKFSNMAVLLKCTREDALIPSIEYFDEESDGGLDAYGYKFNVDFYWEDYTQK